MYYWDMETRDMKRITTGHYEAVINGKHVEIYRKSKTSFYTLVHSRSHEAMRCTNVGWNLRIDGKVVADWLDTKQQAVEAAQRLIK